MEHLSQCVEPEKEDLFFSRVLPLATAEEVEMNVQHSRCCGIDAHKGSATVCVNIFDANGKREARLKTYATDFGELQKLRFWLQSQKVTHVAMESTGTFWKPIWNVLREHFTWCW